MYKSNDVCKGRVPLEQIEHGIGVSADLMILGNSMFNIFQWENTNSRHHNEGWGGLQLGL